MVLKRTKLAIRLASILISPFFCQPFAAADEIQKRSFSELCLICDLTSDLWGLAGRCWQEMELATPPPGHRYPPPFSRAPPHFTRMHEIWNLDIVTLFFTFLSRTPQFTRMHEIFLNNELRLPLDIREQSGVDSWKDGKERAVNSKPKPDNNFRNSCRELLGTLAGWDVLNFVKALPAPFSEKFKHFFSQIWQIFRLTHLSADTLWKGRKSNGGS